MKDSHFTTPRTMNDATWQPWGAAIELTTEPKTPLYDKVIYVLGVISVVLVMFLLLKA